MMLTKIQKRQRHLKQVTNNAASLAASETGDEQRSLLDSY